MRAGQFQMPAEDCGDCCGKEILDCADACNGKDEYRLIDAVVSVSALEQSGVELVPVCVEGLAGKKKNDEGGEGEYYDGDDAGPGYEEKGA